MNRPYTYLMLPHLQSRLSPLYGDQAPHLAEAIRKLVAEYAGSDTTAASGPTESGGPPESIGPAWSERDVVLITYADQISAPDEPPLATLDRFLTTGGLAGLINVVHLLPFYPYSSDDGFSVIDYLAVDPGSGDWPDVARLAGHFDLMFDLVLNHISQHSEWFQKYLAGEEPYDRFFIEADPAEDLSAVVRPRSLPLLSEYETSRGPRHVWTTFSSDQVDLNYAEPEVMLRMLRVLLEYAKRGARIVRLDAVAFLWKEPGTNCIHLPQTHEAVKLMRDVAAEVAPRMLILTETNVPHLENISYFGEGDEAQMVYQFSLPPLLLDAFVNADATPFKEWLAGLLPPRPGTSYFNFTASHDGIGVRPLEGLVSTERLDRLVEHVKSRGGRVGTRRQADGSDTPYELNITYVDALAPAEPDDELHARRFLASQAVMLGLQGMPAVYFHSLVGSQNDYAGLEASGIPRRINRHKYTLAELEQAIGTHGEAQSPLAEKIHAGYRQLLAVRIEQPAFHPDAPQRAVESGSPSVLAFERTSLDGGQKILVAANVSGESQDFTLPGDGYAVDLLSGEAVGSTGSVTLKPGQAVWLA